MGGLRHERKDNMKKQSKFDKWYVGWMGKRIRASAYGNSNTTDETLATVRLNGIMAGLALHSRQGWDNSRAMALQAWNAAQ